jgi:hypothetical protein
MRTRLGSMIACGALSLAACGGKVTVDQGGVGLGGAGGVATTGSDVGGNTTSGNVSTGVASCFTPPAAGTLKSCNASAGSGGTDITCERAFCNAQGDTWTATCTPTTCVCALNTEVLCTCALNGPGDICGGTPSCCPGLQ